ncbi:MAG TPA: TIGR03067 domain-containing protein [Gemmataceae bacterium]|jgi:uncharacterized protein (TIGR03067 family)|nr:TIGR03067 domain-containing protein [Gemmataceae bacterium]
MRRSCLAILFLAVAILAITLVADAKPIRTEKNAPPESLDGVWITTSVEVPGQAKKEGPQIKMTFSANKLTMEVQNETKTAKVAVDFKKKPAEIDIMPTDAPFQGQKVPGIFERKGDTLRICAGNQPGGQRPTEFKSGDGNALITLKLQK